METPSVGWSEEDGVYVARQRLGECLCCTHGDTAEEALANLAVAVAAMQQVIDERSKP